MPDGLFDDLPLGDALARWVGERCDQRPDQVNRDCPLVEFGVSSVEAVELAGRLEERLGAPVPATLLWEYPTINAIERALSADRDPVPRAGTSGPPVARAGGPVAVVGLGCRFPGGASGPDELWRLLLAGRDLVRMVPPDRWRRPPAASSARPGGTPRSGA